MFNILVKAVNESNRNNRNNYKIKYKKIKAYG